MRGVRGMALLALRAVNRPPAAADAVLTIEVGETARRFAAAELLARGDAAEIQIAKDASYGQPMAFTAVPLVGLLGGLTMPAGSGLEGGAARGFSAPPP